VPVSELEPVQNYQTGPADDRLVQKMFQTNKNRQKLAGISRPFTVG
jgi:hypothetical protein